jgi:hypothetical protein
MKIDCFYLMNHRRLRNTYKWGTILRHEGKIMAALDKRHKKMEMKNEK